jgi:hypothetical protein
MAGADTSLVDGNGATPACLARQRPAAVPRAPRELDEYVGIYDLGGGQTIRVWLADGRLHLREFAPDELYAVGDDDFHCVQEPWSVRFLRDDSASVAGIEVDFLRRTVRGARVAHPRYVGSRVCAGCHGAETGGGEHVAWLRSGHALAYWRLATDWARHLAERRPQYRDVADPRADERCLLCHVTAAQDPNALLAADYRREEGVGCEACHGPGSAYASAAVMGDRELFLAAGGVVPDAETCRRCHRDEHFSFDAWWPRIAHGGD